MIKKNNSIAVSFAIIMLPIILMLGIYIQVHGDYTPGGGFQAGMITAISLILVHLLYDSVKAIRMEFLIFMSFFGVALYASVGCVSLLKGQNFLDYSAIGGNHSYEIGIVTIELGVGITVCSVMLVIFFSLMEQYKK